MALIRRLWTGERVEHDGRYVTVDGDINEPLPLQEPHPYIVSAGASSAGLALAARFSDNLFLPSAASRDTVIGLRKQLAPLLEAHGRAASELSLSINLMILVRDTDTEEQADAADCGRPSMSTSFGSTRRPSGESVRRTASS